MTWILPPSGMTLQRSTEKYSTLKLTSSLVDSHAKTFQLQVKAQELSQTHEVDYSFTSCDLFGNIDHSSSFSKMLQQFVVTGSTPYCGKLPKQGMMQNGVAYPLPKQEHHTNVTGGGCWPTPRASEWKDCGQSGSKSQISMSKKHYLCAVVKDGQQDKTNHNMNGNQTVVLNPDWVETLMGYPIGWTESKHWATQLCPKRQGKHSKL